MLLFFTVTGGASDDSGPVGLCLFALMCLCVTIGIEDVRACMCVFPVVAWLSISPQIILFLSLTHTHVPQTLNHTVMCSGILSANGKPGSQQTKVNFHKHTDTHKTDSALDILHPSRVNQVTLLPVISHCFENLEVGLFVFFT